MTTLAELKSDLEQPFPPALVEFLPKDMRQEDGNSTCLALPYCNKRVYEDRLNELAYGEWQTVYAAPYTQGNKLIIPATVIICGVMHTDYGEAFLSIQAKNGVSREDENSATEAYSQAFRRACAQFGLGRYLYNLGKLRLPYDPKHKVLAISKAERLAWVEKLYRKAGLPLPAVLSPMPQPQIRAAQRTEANQEGSPVSLVAQYYPIPPTSTNDYDTIRHTSQSVVSAQTTQATHYPDDRFLDWVARQVQRDAQRIQGICDFYQVQCLAQLNQTQRENVTQRLKRQQRKSQPEVQEAHVSV